jgi:histidinol-phosphatase (PHP family)
MIKLVSIHGGHSGEFCNHAQDTLEEVVQAYIAKGFAWAGLTEHIPPNTDAFLYPDEIEVGLTAVACQQRFSRYIAEARRLQTRYADQIQLFVGFETDAYSGYGDYVKQLVRDFQPDYFVGSVHHIGDFPFDLSKAGYDEVATAVGGLANMYCHYFDQQYDMLQTIQPRVVGHFDYVRILDPDYPTQLQQPQVWSRILRNLQYIQEQHMVLDFNVKAFRKGQPEPYVSQPILREALARGITIVPGDDSHGINSVGEDIDRGIAILQAARAETNWQLPITDN